MKAYKGFKRHDDGTLWCKGFQYEPGKTYKYEGEVALCCRGFHACHEFYQVWRFYPNNGNNVFYEVECGGKIIESDDDDGKFVCSEITLIKEINMSDNAQFDWAWSFHEGFARVELNLEYSFIDTKGKQLSEQWYDYACYFSEGYAVIRKDGKYNFIDTKGKLLSERWYDDACDFSEDFAKVRLDGKYNFINTEGKRLSKQWYDYACYFSEGFAAIRLNGKYNFIDTKGKLLSERWYDEACDFCEGFAQVKLNDKLYYIDKEGKIVE